MPNGQLIYLQKETPQGGIISPLLANIVLNELDHWVESNWEENPVVYKYSKSTNTKGTLIISYGYMAMRKTNLKEMYIVRYADDFRIFCRTKTVAEKTKIAVIQWLSERLNLEVSQEKTRVVNVKRRYSEFLGFKIKVHSKGEKQVVKSHINDKQLKTKKKAFIEQVKRIARPRPEKGLLGEIRQYNKKFVSLLISSYYNFSNQDIIKTSINVAIDTDKGTSHNSLQLVIDKNFETYDEKIRFLHDGLITKFRGRLPTDGLRKLVAEKYPEIIRGKKFYLGTLMHNRLFY